MFLLSHTKVIQLWCSGLRITCSALILLRVKVPGVIDVAENAGRFIIDTVFSVSDCIRVRVT